MTRGVFFGLAPASVADVRAYITWTGCAQHTALQPIIGQGPAQARASIEAYRQALLAARMPPADVTPRVDALIQVTRTAQTLGVIPWALTDGTVPVTRTTAQALVTAAEMACAQQGATGIYATRDVAILRLLYDLALRRGEIVLLDLAHVELPPDLACEARIWILRTGTETRIPLAVPPATRAALVRWIARRGDAPGALFTSASRCRRGVRLTARGVWRIVERWGVATQRRATPRGMRAASLRAAAEVATPADLESFVHGRCLDAELAFNDARRLETGKIASRVADTLGVHTGTYTAAPRNRRARTT